MQVTYGTHTLDFTKLPAKSLEAMLKRGVTHFLGNEQASKVSGWKARFVETEKREPNDDEVAEVKSAYIAKALEGKANIWTYPQLAKMRSIDEALGQFGYFVRHV